MPGVAILVVGPSDKATKIDGVLQTDPSLPLITEALRNAMAFISSLDAKNPTLKNTILAFHGLAKKRVPTWQEIVDEMGVGKPVLKRYRAPESVMQQIDGMIKKHHTQRNVKTFFCSINIFNNQIDWHTIDVARPTVIQSGNSFHCT